MPTSPSLSKVEISKKRLRLRKRVIAVVLTALLVVADVVGVLKPGLAGMVQHIVSAVQAVGEINNP